MAVSTNDLRFLVDLLSKPPFNRTKLSVVELHDDLPHPDLIVLLNQALAHIDLTNPNSPHTVDIRNETPDITGARMADFIVNSLGYQGAGVDLVARKIVSGDDRSFLLHILYYLLNDVPKLQQQAYKSRFCRPCDIPLELSGDEQLQEILLQIKDRQQVFSNTLSQAEQLHEPSQITTNLKRDVAQMEEEKNLIHGKIQRMQRKVIDIPNSTQWLQAARALRTEQDRERQLHDRLNDLKVQCTSADDRLTIMQKRVIDTREMSQVDPSNMLSRLQKDVQTNRFLVMDKLAKELESVNQAVVLLQKIVNEPIMSATELVKLEHEVESLNEEVKDLTEKRVQTHNTQDKLSLFRQQASVIANKKSVTADRLREAMNKLESIKNQYAKVTAEVQAHPTAASMPKGEEFKTYVTELRNKSNVYKTKRTIIVNLTAELNIAQTTRDILIERKQIADRQLQMLEQRHGVSGLRKTRTTLEQVSSKKGNIDEAKANIVEDMTTLVQSLMTAITERKAILAPKIAELKLQRAKLNELETQHTEQKRNYDTIILSLETDIQQLQLDLRTLQHNFIKDTSQWHLVSHQNELIDGQMDIILQEMKTYIGNVTDSDPNIRARGYKTWRDLYQRKILEAEANNRQFTEQLRQVQERHESNVLQKRLFSTIKLVLNARINANDKILERATKGINNRSKEIVTANEQRLIIS